MRLKCQHAPEPLHDQHRLDTAAAKSAMFLGKGQAEQAELGILRPQRAAPSLRLGEISLALLEGVGVGEQPVDALAQQPLLFGQIKVHYSPSTPFDTMFFMISFVPP